MSSSDFYKKEIDVIEKIIEELLDLNRDQNSRLSLNRSDLTKEIIQALAASNLSLKSTIEENLLNITRELFLSYGFDLAKLCPTLINAKINSEKMIYINKGSEFLLANNPIDEYNSNGNENNRNFYGQERVYFTNFDDFLFMPLNIQQSFIDNNILQITISSPLEITREILNNILFYAKGSFAYKFINHCLKNPVIILKINGIKIMEGEFSYWPFKTLPLMSMGREKYNRGIETLLNILMNQDYGRFFQLHFREDIPKTKEITFIINVTEEEKRNNTTIHNNHIPLQNIFFRDSLPFAVNQESLYTPQTLEEGAVLYAMNNLRILSNNEVIYIGNILKQPGESTVLNTFAKQVEQGIFWSGGLIKSPINKDLQWGLELSNETKIIFEKNQAILNCTMENSSQQIENLDFNQPLSLFNNAMINDIYLYKITHEKKQWSSYLDKDNFYFLKIIREYIDCYTTQYTISHCKEATGCIFINLWNSLKKMANLLGEANREDLLNVNILEETIALKEKIFIEGNKYYLKEVIFIKIKINDHFYCAILQHYFTGIVKNWYEECVLMVFA